MKRMMLLALGVALLSWQSAHAQSPYYPLKIGDKWTYRVVDLKAPPGKVDPKRTVVVEVEREEIYARKTTDKTGKVNVENKTGFLLKSTSGGKTTRDHVVFLDDGFYRVHAAGTPITPPLPFFKFGLSTWTCNCVSGNTTITGTFAVKKETIRVLDKTYDTFEVTFNNGKDGESRVEIDCWFAKDIGMVKQRVLEKGRAIGLELERFEAAR